MIDANLLPGTGVIKRAANVGYINRRVAILFAGIETDRFVILHYAVGASEPSPRFAHSRDVSEGHSFARAISAANSNPVRPYDAMLGFVEPVG